MPYEDNNTLRFVLAHMLRTEYKRSPADFPDLFSTEGLTKWRETGLTGTSILRRVVGPKPDRKAS